MPNAVSMGFGAKPETLQQSMTQYAQRPGWSQFPAIKQTRFYALYHGGVRTLYDYILCSLSPRRFFLRRLKM